VPTVREISDDLNVPAPWVVKTLLRFSLMKTISSELTEDEVALLTTEAARRDEPNERA
jgi:Translation initiation factor IF-2, N-terminal region